MGYFVYVIQSEKDGSLYKGISQNIEERVKQHNSGKNKSTSYKRPFKLIILKNALIELKQEREKNILSRG